MSLKALPAPNGGTVSADKGVAIEVKARLKQQEWEANVGQRTPKSRTTSATGK
jgi:hypothetical protein